MKVAVFIPGTMGTQLHSGSGEELWPPKPLETQFGYKRIDKLMADDVQFGAIIRNVACIDFYGSILDAFKDLHFVVGDPNTRLFPFPYDWRKDLEQTADRLAGELDSFNGQQVQEIHLVAHSMGGLITRLVLESGRYTNRPWFGLIRSFISLAVPHQGAPLALARILGLDSALGISKADFRKFSNNLNCPSGYQLLPAPGELACWDQTADALAAVDIYDEGNAARLGLDPKLLARARFVHDTLSAGKRPANVRYFYFAGSGHTTMTRINVFRDNDGKYPVDGMQVTNTDDGGDGTVPAWSALPHAGQRQVVVNEHAHVFTGTPFKKVFYRLMGGDLGPALQSILDDLPPEPLRLSLAAPIVEYRKEFELLLIPPEPMPKIDGAIVIQDLREDGEAKGAAEEFSPIHYSGARVSNLRLTMPAIVDPGWYQLTFVGTPCNSEPIRFSVAQLPG